ncbi:MAG: hypothetical protein HC906_03295, partial [Bacteroidales bacterium]|nr:hypothetical protein [Bacteroidales bacterium]
MKKFKTMWKSNFKQAIRYIVCHKTYSFVIIIGLSVGFAASFLIYSYVFYEKSYDNFHENGKNLYRVIVTSRLEGSDPYKSPYSYAPQGPVAKSEIPEVEDYVRLLAFPSVVVSSNDQNEKRSNNVSNYYYADESFFELFTFPLIVGDFKSVLKDPGSLVLSETLANKLFGSSNCIGKTVDVDGQYTCTITGVFNDIPQNTHLKFDMLISLNTFPWIMNPGNAWGNHSFFTYLFLKNNSNITAVEHKLTQAYLKENRAIHQANCTWHLQPVSEAYLNTSDFTSKPEAFNFGEERMVFFLGLVALFILCIAWINYINLTTAKSVERLKEIGVKKTSGAGRWQIILQFFTESILFNIISITISFTLVMISFKWFIKTVSFHSTVIHSSEFWFIVIVFILIGLIIPGVLTALLTSQNIRPSFNKVKGNSSFRNGLITFQFAIIMALIAGVFIVNKQLRYIQSIDLGFEKEQVLVLNAPRVGFNNQIDGKLKTFKDELQKQTSINDVTASVSIPGERFGSGNSGPSITGLNENDTYFRVGRVWANYLGF